MIIDVHAHVFRYPEHFTEQFQRQAMRARGDSEIDLSAGYEAYLAQAREPVQTVVFGGKARLSGMWVDDRYVAARVAENPDSLYRLPVGRPHPGRLAGGVERGSPGPRSQGH